MASLFRSCGRCCGIKSFKDKVKSNDSDDEDDSVFTEIDQPDARATVERAQHETMQETTLQPNVKLNVTELQRVNETFIPALTGPANSTRIRRISCVDDTSLEDDDDADDDVSAFYSHSKFTQPIAEPYGRYVPMVRKTEHKECVSSKPQESVLKHPGDVLSDDGIKIRRKDKTEYVDEIFKRRDLSKQPDVAFERDSEFKPPKKYVLDDNFKANRDLVKSYISKLDGTYDVISDISDIKKKYPQNDATYLLPVVLSVEETGSTGVRKHAVLAVAHEHMPFQIVESKDYENRSVQCTKIKKSVKRQLNHIFQMETEPGDILVPKLSNSGFCATYVWLNTLVYALFSGTLPEPIRRAEMDDESVNLLMAVKLYQMHRGRAETSLSVEKERQNFLNLATFTETLRVDKDFFTTVRHLRPRITSLTERIKYAKDGDAPQDDAGLNRSDEEAYKKANSWIQTFADYQRLKKDYPGCFDESTSQRLNVLVAIQKEFIGTYKKWLDLSNKRTGVSWNRTEQNTTGSSVEDSCLSSTSSTVAISTPHNRTLDLCPADSTSASGSLPTTPHNASDGNDAPMPVQEPGSVCQPSDNDNAEFVLGGVRKRHIVPN